MADKKPLVPIIFGEVLFDSFPDGTQVLGGAPFNVAWHLQGFGLEPLMISAIGDDELGRTILRRMESWGMNREGLQVNEIHPTGVVKVSMIGGEPSYEILRERAWDFIDPESALQATKKQEAALLYHGSLAARSPVSRDTLNALRETIKSPIFVDINLRPPDWNLGLVRKLLSGSSWIKLNGSELREIGYKSSSLEEAAQNLLDHYRVELVITTMGGEGALINTPKPKPLKRSPKKINDLVDTVGAGDAFSSVVILGLVSGWDPALILERAVEFAGEICRIQGATINNPDLYQNQLKKWNQEEFSK